MRWGVWYIGGRRRKHRQKKGFLPVGAILGTLVSPALGALAGPTIEKIFGGKKTALPLICLDKKCC